MKLAQFQILRLLTTDARFLFAARLARMFAYGFLSVVLVLYLAQVGLNEMQVGLLLTLTLIGDTIISLWITTNADRIGRRRMLIVGAALMIFAGVLFALTRNFVFLLITATLGVISPSGYEVGPFLAIEQAALSQNDGIYTHSIQYLVDSGTPDAKPPMGDYSSLVAFQHLPDGCTDSPILYDGCRGPR